MTASSHGPRRRFADVDVGDTVIAGPSSTYPVVTVVFRQLTPLSIPSWFNWVSKEIWHLSEARQKLPNVKQRHAAPRACCSFSCVIRCCYKLRAHTRLNHPTVPHCAAETSPESSPMTAYRRPRCPDVVKPRWRQCRASSVRWWNRHCSHDKA